MQWLLSTAGVLKLIHGNLRRQYGHKQCSKIFHTLFGQSAHCHFMRKGHAHAMGSYITSAAGRADAAGGGEHLVPADAELADAGGHGHCGAVCRPRSRPRQLPSIHNALPRHHRPLVQFYALLHGKLFAALVALAKASMGDLVWHLDLSRHGKPVAAPGRVEPFAESQVVVKDAICPGAGRG